MRIPTFVLALALASSPLTVLGEEAAARPVAIPQSGFHGLPWGAGLDQVWRAFPELKKAYPRDGVRKGMAAGGIYLSVKLTFKDKPYPGKLYLDEKGLHRVAFHVDVVRDPDNPVTLDQALDPLTGDLPAPTELGEGRKLWKLADRVVSTEPQPLPNGTRLVLTFQAPDRYRPDAAGESLGID